MSEIYFTVRNDVEGWIKHFTAIIDGKVIPDEINNIFPINQNPTKPSNVHEKPKQITKTQQILVLISCHLLLKNWIVLRLFWMSRRERFYHRIVILFHISQTTIATRTVESVRGVGGTKKVEKRRRKQQKKNTSKAKKRKLSIWQKF